MQQGDEIAKALFARLGRRLGVGIASLANIFEVDAVVVGGLVETGELLLAPARATAREYAYAPTARGIPATFGGDAGKIGAASRPRPRLTRAGRTNVHRLLGELRAGTPGIQLMP